MPSLQLLWGGGGGTTGAETIADLEGHPSPLEHSPFRTYASASAFTPTPPKHTRTLVTTAMCVVPIPVDSPYALPSCPPLSPLSPLISHRPATPHRTPLVLYTPYHTTTTHSTTHAHTRPSRHTPHSPRHTTPYYSAHHTVILLCTLYCILLCTPYRWGWHDGRHARRHAVGKGD